MQKITPPRISSTDNRDYILLGEVKNLCPICGKSLLVQKKQRTVKHFDKAHIYPHSPTVQQIEALKGLTPPHDIESMENIIALCKDCHINYDSFVDEDDYLKMLALKQKLSTEYKLTADLANIPVENDILKVLKELENMPLDEISRLRLDPIPIKNKIPSGPLQSKVLNLTTQYFQYLQLQFQHMDTAQTHRFSKIASMFGFAYHSAAEQNLLQDVVFDQLVLWLKNKTMGSTTSCEVVISYFIHDCEVFDAISK